MAQGVQEAGMRYGRAPQLNISATIGSLGVTADLGALLQATTTIMAQTETTARFNSELLGNGGYLNATTLNDHKVITIPIVNTATSNAYMNQQLENLNRLLIFSEGKTTGAPQKLRIEYFNALLPDEKVVGRGEFIDAPYPTLSAGGDNPQNIIANYTFRFLTTREDINEFNLAAFINSILSGAGITEGLL